MSEIDAKPFPRGPLIGAAILIAVAIGSTAAVRLTGGVAPSGVIEAGVAASHARTLRFIDAGEGRVIVEDAAVGRAIADYGTGEGGFVRSVMRSFARDRRSLGIGQEPPFALTRWADGTLTIEDTATRRRIALNAFGPDNAGAFAQLLSGEQPL